MNEIRMVFERASALYDIVFADWLYIHFAVRTLILLLIMWILIYACTQVFQYLLGPLLVLCYYHVLFRAWNFLFVETLHEWIYIRYYSEDEFFLSRLYLRLCDSIKQNRLKLQHTRYTGILYRGRVRQVAIRLMVIAMVIVGSWTLGFGLYNEYAADGRVAGTYPSGQNNSDDTSAETSDKPEGQDSTTEPDNTSKQPGSVITEDGGYTTDAFTDPATWPETAKITFTLNRHGAGGSNIRDLPGGGDSTPIDVVRGDAVLEYLHEYVSDDKDSTLLWIKVRTPSGTEGYISSKLLVVHAD